MTQNRQKIARIDELLADLRFKLDDLQFNNTACANEKNGTYYDYDDVIALFEQTLPLLEQAVDRQKGTARNPRPADLPKDIPWRETFADPDEDFNPYVFDGSMSPEDYDKMMAAYEADRNRPVAGNSKPKEGYNLSATMRDAKRKHATVDLAHPDREPVPYDALPDADLKAGKVLKIRFFDVHGVYALQTNPFSEKQLKFETTVATNWIDGCKPDTGYAGWRVFEWDEQKRQWWPYRDSKNQERLYDTGRRA
ncbi:MAG: hypothetical protein ABF904_09905 [Ethanoligenens sp.]